MQSQKLHNWLILLILMSCSTLPALANDSKEPITKYMGKLHDGTEWYYFHPSDTTKKGYLKKNAKAEFGVIVNGEKKILISINPKESKNKIIISDVRIKHISLHWNYFVRDHRSFKNTKPIRDYFVLYYPYDSYQNKKLVKKTGTYIYNKYGERIYGTNDEVTSIEDIEIGDYNFIKISTSRNVRWLTNLIHTQQGAYIDLGETKPSFQNYAGLEFLKANHKYYYLFIQSSTLLTYAHFELIGDDMQLMNLAENKDIKFIKVINNGHTGYLSLHKLGRWIAEPTYKFGDDEWYYEEFIATPDGKGFLKITKKKYSWNKRESEYVILSNLSTGEQLVSKKDKYRYVTQLKESPSYFVYHIYNGDSHERDGIMDSNGKTLMNSKCWIYDTSSKIIKTSHNEWIIAHVDCKNTYQLWHSNKKYYESETQRGIEYRNDNGLEYFLLKYGQYNEYVYIYDIDGNKLLPSSLYQKDITDVKNLTFADSSFILVQHYGGHKKLLSNFTQNSRFPNYYDDINVVSTSFGRSFLQFKKDKTVKLLDEKWKDVIPPFAFDIIDFVERNRQLYFITKRHGKYSWEDKYGLLGENFSEILPTEYAQVKFLGGRYILFKRDSHYGIITLQGKVIIPASRCYTEISYDSNKKVFAFKKDGGIKGECDNSGKQISLTKPTPPKNIASNNNSSSQTRKASQSVPEGLLYKGRYTYGDGVDVETGTIMNDLHLSGEIEIYEDHLHDGITGVYASYTKTTNSGSRAYEGNDPFGNSRTYYVSSSFNITMVEDFHSQWGYNRIRTTLSKGEASYYPGMNVNNGNNGNSYNSSSTQQSTNSTNSNPGLTAAQYQYNYNGYEDIVKGIFRTFEITGSDMPAGVRAQNMQLLRNTQNDMRRIRQEAASHGITIQQSSYETASP